MVQKAFYYSLMILYGLTALVAGGANIYLHGMNNGALMGTAGGGLVVVVMIARWRDARSGATMDLLDWVSLAGAGVVLGGWLFSLLG